MHHVAKTGQRKYLVSGSAIRWQAVSRCGVQSCRMQWFCGSVAMCHEFQSDIH